MKLINLHSWEHSTPDWTKLSATWSYLLADPTWSRRFDKRLSKVTSNLNDPMILKFPTCLSKHRFKNWTIWSRWTRSGANHIIPFHLLWIVLEIIQLLIIISASRSAVCMTRELIKCFFCYLTLVYKHFYSTHKCCANSALTIMNQGSRNTQSTACSHRRPAWLGEAPSRLLVVLSH